MNNPLEQLNLIEGIVALTSKVSTPKNFVLTLSNDKAICNKCARCNLSLILSALLSEDKLNDFYPLGITILESGMHRKCTVCKQYFT